MKLIKKLGTSVNRNGTVESWAEFQCPKPICNKIVERTLSNGKIAKSCGCDQYSEERNKKISERNKLRIVTEETKNKIRLANTGKIPTEETKNKIRLANTGKKRTNKQKENLSKALLGKKKSEEHKQKMKEVKKGKHVGKDNPNYGNGDKIKGEKNPNWQGGKSFEEYSEKFNKYLKNKIKKRDNYLCQNPFCKGEHKILHVHHINYDKQNNNPKNLITLCASCHTITHNKDNRQYWTKYYQNIINKIEVKK